MPKKATAKPAEERPAAKTEPKAKPQPPAKKKAPARPRGRPAFKPTAAERNLVKIASGFGLPQEKICLLVSRPKGKAKELEPISEPTLRKHFREELDVGEVTASMKVIQTLYDIATNPKHPQAFQAARFWVKARNGWTERLDIAAGLSLEFDFSGLSEQEIAVAEKLIRAQLGKQAPTAANAA